MHDDPDVEKVAAGLADEQAAELIEPADPAMQAELQALLLVFGGMLTIPMPVTGLTITTRSEYASRAVVKAAERNPRVMAVLKRILGASTWAELGHVAVMVGVAVGVDAGSIPPESPLVSNVAGITDVVQTVEGMRQQQRAAQAQAEAANPDGEGVAEPIPNLG